MPAETDDAPRRRGVFSAPPDTGTNLPASSGRMPQPGGKLKTKSEFDDVKAHAIRFSNSLFLVLAAPAREGEGVRCGIICSRRFDKRAVVRNRARRLLWEAFRLLKQRIPPCRIILIPRKRIVPGYMPDVKMRLERLIPALEKAFLSPKSASPSRPPDCC